MCLLRQYIIKRQCLLSTDYMPRPAFGRIQKEIRHCFSLLFMNLKSNQIALSSSPSSVT